MMLKTDNLSPFRRLVITFAHCFVMGELIEFEMPAPFVEPVIVPAPPAPELADKPIQVMLGELRRKHASAVSHQHFSIRYNEFELQYIEEGDYLIIPPTKKRKTCYYKVMSRTGSKLTIIETTYFPRLS